MRKCNYCHDSDNAKYIVSKDFRGPILSGIATSVNGDKLETVFWFGAEELVAEAKIKYCPMCGRRLTNPEG